ncbi:ankyrin repeat domain-containing protein [Dactylosporangium sp. AC04546]|uniref:ankyrin repeat domain-containing protein n=1 Tax=Dactylosporangium sp. AC04546 TaxID=2862460 RepID=UPI001EDDA3E2|nr:ankyrin repeat domain-containing protein [Dactylosporangium sp. AC04546]WVK81923.1 ankyrin repeat domain-containing protein [Dactylosporangium sp. AC04546]
MTTALVPAGELGTWRRIRHYAVPARMIRAATEARLAGDWRAACAAAAVDVDAEADFGPFEDDLRHFAPDLLRWHLPRHPGRGDTTIAPRLLVVLVRDDGKALCVELPRLGFGSQRLRLVVLDEDDVNEDGRYHGLHELTERRYLWDAREAPELLARTSPDFRDSPVLALQDAGRQVEAWNAGGIALADAPELEDDDWRTQYFNRTLASFDLDPAVVLAAARERGMDTVRLRVGWYYEIHLTGILGGGPVRGEWVPNDREDSIDLLDADTLRRPVDVHLVRLGLLPAERLHPLVLAAFDPSAAWRPFEPPAGAPVRVRCGEAWHDVHMTGGRFTVPHSDEERQREETMRALGGETHGCFAAERAWRHRGERLPRELEDQRRDLMLRAQHGDVAGVTALLDAGIDPHARDLHGRTLLHLLPCLGGDLALLDRLLAAGLDLDDRDNRGYSVLHVAVRAGGSPELVRALLAAGADPDTEDFVGDTLAEDVERLREHDLAFLVT